MRVLAVLAFIAWGVPGWAQWDPAGGEPGSLAVERTDPRILRWADSAIAERGWYDISDKDSGVVEGGNPGNTYGMADNYTLSLGDSGRVTLFFDPPVKNVEGIDFAVFENGFKWFSGYFLELAFVEVSSDGSRFVRFPAQSTADTGIQYTNNAAMQPEQYHNLAGKHQAPYGTPFDLDELQDSAGIDLDSIYYIRLVDVIGSVDPALASRDVNGRIINDPWPTPFGIGGFDLDAIAVFDAMINSVGTPDKRLGMLVPNPVRRGQAISWQGNEDVLIRIHDLATGREVIQGRGRDFAWVPVTSGIYVAELYYNGTVKIQRICVTD